MDLSDGRNNHWGVGRWPVYPGAIHSLCASSVRRVMSMASGHIAATAVYNGISRAGESGHHDARTPAAPPESDRGLSAVDLGPPAAWDRQAYAPARAPPVLGEHTDEVLTEAGFSSGEIETMRKNKII